MVCFWLCDLMCSYVFLSMCVVSGVLCDVCMVCAVRVCVFACGGQMCLCVLFANSCVMLYGLACV